MHPMDLPRRRSVLVAMEDNNNSIELLTSICTVSVSLVFYYFKIICFKSYNNSHFRVHQETLEKEKQPNEKKGRIFRCRRIFTSSILWVTKNCWKSRTVLERCLFFLTCAMLISVAVLAVFIYRSNFPASLAHCSIICIDLIYVLFLQNLVCATAPHASELRLPLLHLWIRRPILATISTSTPAVAGFAHIPFRKDFKAGQL